MWALGMTHAMLLDGFEGHSMSPGQTNTKVMATYTAF